MQDRACDVPFLVGEAGASTGPTASDESFLHESDASDY
jgi:hypothetical protein